MTAGSGRTDGGSSGTGRDPRFARIGEEDIAQGLEKLEESLREATSAAERLADRAGLEETLEDAQRLQDRMASLDRRLSQRTGQEGGEPGDRGEAGQEGQEGQSGEQGQAGQQGRGSQTGDPQARGGQAGGGRGGLEPSDPRGAVDPGGSGAVGGAQRPLSPEERRQLQREIQERLGEATALRDELQAAGQDVSELNRAMEAMQSLRRDAVLDDLPQVAVLRETIRESLGRVEFSLRREVRGDEAPAALAGSEAVPEGFRRLVEEYYRSLARERGGGR